MDIRISVPGGRETAEITAGPGGREPAIEVGDGRKQAAQAQVGRSERQPGVEIEMEAGQ